MPYEAQEAVGAGSPAQVDKAVRLLAALGAENDKNRLALILRVGDRLREECLKVFGSTWSYDVAWRFAGAAIAEIENSQALR